MNAHGLPTSRMLIKWAPHAEPTYIHVSIWLPRIKKQSHMKIFLQWPPNIEYTLPALTENPYSEGFRKKQFLCNDLNKYNLSAMANPHRESSHSRHPT